MPDGEPTVVVAGLGLEGTEGVDLRHAAPRVVGVTGALLHGLLGQARVQIHDFSWGSERHLILASAKDNRSDSAGPKPQLLVEPALSSLEASHRQQHKEASSISRFVFRSCVLRVLNLLLARRNIWSAD